MMQYSDRLAQNHILINIFSPFPPAKCSNNNGSDTSELRQLQGFYLANLFVLSLPLPDLLAEGVIVDAFLL